MDRHNHNSSASTTTVAKRKRTVTTVLTFLILLVGYAACPLISTAQAATSGKSLLTINAFSLPDGSIVGVLVEVRSGDTLIKSGFAPLTVEGQVGAIYTIKVSNTGSYAFDHWQDGSKSNVKAVMLPKDDAASITVAAFFEKVAMPPNLTVRAVTANGEELHMWTSVNSGIQTVSSGLTPFSFSGAPGRTYQLTVENQEANESASMDGGGAPLLSGSVPISIIFNHWLDDGNNRSTTRSVTLPANGKALNLIGVYNKGDRVTLEDLGVLQLVSHDLYNTIRDGPHPGNIEDERLNLSTVLDHGEDQIAVGGEPRNSENIALHTVAVKLGKMYLDLIIDKKMSPQDAREQTVQTYLQMVAKAYQDTFHEPLPDPAPSEHEVKPDGSDNLTGDLSLRAVHSYVPGHIMVNGVDTMVLDPSLRGKTLSDEDMQQLSKPLDGTFDPVFRNVTIFLPPPNPPPNSFTVDLFERDSSFAKQFGTDVSFEEFMNELRDGRFDANDKVTFYLREDIANGLMPPEEDEQEKNDTKVSTELAGAVTEDATTAIANSMVENETVVGDTLAKASPPNTEIVKEQMATTMAVDIGGSGSKGQQLLSPSPQTTTDDKNGGTSGSIDQGQARADEERDGGSSGSNDEQDQDGSARDDRGNNKTGDVERGDGNAWSNGRHHDGDSSVDDRDRGNSGGNKDNEDSGNGRHDIKRDNERHDHSSRNNNNNDDGNDDNISHRLRWNLR